MNGSDVSPELMFEESPDIMTNVQEVPNVENSQFQSRTESEESSLVIV